MKPIILIPAGKIGQRAQRGDLQSVTATMNMNYVNSVLRSGGAPVVLPCYGDQEAIQAALAVADGILLTGGGDVISLTYGEQPHAQSLYQDPTRDDMEFELTTLALQREMPILAICRGVQLLNVVFGGTLIQDVPSQVKDPIQHYSRGLDTLLSHTIEIAPDTLLSRVMKTREMAVNSFHHQAVRDIGPGLRSNCWARDGVIEGLESEDTRPILGVQFHPEECTAAYPQFQPLFDWLVQEASARRKE